MSTLFLYFLCRADICMGSFCCFSGGLALVFWCCVWVRFHVWGLLRGDGRQSLFVGFPFSWSSRADVHGTASAFAESGFLWSFAIRTCRLLVYIPDAVRLVPGRGGNYFGTISVFCNFGFVSASFGARGFGELLGPIATCTRRGFGSRLQWAHIVDFPCGFLETVFGFRALLFVCVIVRVCACVCVRVFLDWWSVCRSVFICRSFFGAAMPCVFVQFFLCLAHGCWFLWFAGVVVFWRLAHAFLDGWGRSRWQLCVLWLVAVAGWQCHFAMGSQDWEVIGL